VEAEVKYPLRRMLAAVLVGGCVAAAQTAAGQATAGRNTATMQAIVVVHGKAQLQTVPRPDPKAGQVRIKVRAAGVNPADWKRAQRQPDSGLIPGWDVAGVIDTVGPSVRGWKAGDAVIGYLEGVGGYAQYAVVPVEHIARKPDKLSFDQAAGIPLAGATAWRALVDQGHLSAGQAVLIQGAAGGVGSAAVQIAAARGATRIIGTASKQNDRFLRSIGATGTVDYHTADFERRIRGLDIVLNTVNPATAARSIQMLRPGGVLLSTAGAAPAAQCAAARVRCISVQVLDEIGTPKNQALADIGKLADQGKYTVNIDATFPLAEAARAWELNRAGHTVGKIILTIPQ
jgi:NADPH:quinone reductase-like Zn-dependent oxidoreductase